MNTTLKAQIEACQALFGEHPIDVLDVIKEATEALLSLREIFRTIEQEAPETIEGFRLKRLASAGSTISESVSQHTGGELESMRDSMTIANDAATTGETA